MLGVLELGGNAGPGARLCKRRCFRLENDSREGAQSLLKYRIVVNPSSQLPATLQQAYDNGSSAQRQAATIKPSKLNCESRSGRKIDCHTVDSD
jgi:hypothetical protein